jgi:hypothetical protein
MNNSFSAIAKKGNFSSISFLSWASKQNLLQCDKSGKSTKPKRLDGSLSRCVFLKMPSDSVICEVEDDGEFVKINEIDQEELLFN